MDTRFVKGFLGQEKCTNRVRGEFQKTKCKIYFLTKQFLIEDSLICPQNPIDSHFFGYISPQSRVTYCYSNCCSFWKTWKSWYNFLKLLFWLRLTLSNRGLDSRSNLLIYCYSIIDNRELVSHWQISEKSAQRFFFWNLSFHFISLSVLFKRKISWKHPFLNNRYITRHFENSLTKLPL